MQKFSFFPPQILLFLLSFWYIHFSLSFLGRCDESGDYRVILRLEEEIWRMYCKLPPALCRMSEDFKSKLWNTRIIFGFSKFSTQQAKLQKVLQMNYTIKKSIIHVIFDKSNLLKLEEFFTSAGTLSHRYLTECITNANCICIRDLFLNLVSS